MDEEEELYFMPSRKESKEARKAAQARDRSKYKKTDLEKYLKSVEQDKQSRVDENASLQGRVLSILPQEIIVDHTGSIYRCTLKGLFKKERTHLKHPIAVGDLVLFEPLPGNEGTIAQVLPRQTILSRADNLSRRKEQILAANVDQVIITLSVCSPPLRCPLIDRYIIAARKGGMAPIIVVNKVDLLTQPDAADPAFIEGEKELYDAVKQIYNSLQIPFIGVSAQSHQGIDLLKERMQYKVSVFTGQSGVGKSSLINIMTGLQRAVGGIVNKTGKGSHTTTTTELIPLPFGGWCVDTPGIKSFGLWNLALDEIEEYFTEIHEYGMGCKFTNCTHTLETECAVLNAVEEGKISVLRLHSYQILRESIKDKHIKR